MICLGKYCLGCEVCVRNDWREMVCFIGWLGVSEEYKVL